MGAVKEFQLKTGHHLKARFPRAYEMYAKYNSYRPFEQIREYFRYRRCIKKNKPYFGNFMLTQQSSPLRYSFMSKLIEAECTIKRSDPYRILEIGSWAGRSSIVWAESLKRFNEGNGEVFCIDSWENYFEINNRSGLSQRRMKMALSKNMIFPLFLHNMRASGHDNIVFPLKGTSQRLLPTLRRGRFNLVYVDGDHRYSAVKSDLMNSVDLIVDGGILCGDDLDLQGFEIDLEYAKKHLNEDCILDHKQRGMFHPGVTVAVDELFGKVTTYENFWAIRKRGKGWEKMGFDGLDPNREL